MDKIANVAAVVAVVAAIVAAVSGYVLLYRQLLLMHLRRRFEDIFVVGCLPDGSAPELGQFDDFVDFAKPTQVHREVTYWSNMLEQAQNVTGARVHSWQYRYGQHCNETPDEYAQRVIQDIAALRSARHQEESSADPDWYEKYERGQEGVRYEW